MFIPKTYRMFISGVYFGLIVGTTDLAGDPYVNFALGAALEIGLAILGWAGMERWGRKPVIAGSALLAGTGCLVTAATKGKLSFHLHCLPSFFPWLFLYLSGPLKTCEYFTVLFHLVP